MRKAVGIEVGPVCLRCGSAMVPRRRKADGEPFFGCIRFPACREMVSFASAAMPSRRASGPPGRAVGFLARSAFVVVATALVYLVATNAGTLLAQAFTR